MDLASLASTVQAQMEQISILQDELKKKETIQNDLIKRLENMEIDPLLHDPTAKSKKSPSKGKAKNKPTPSKQPKPAPKSVPSPRSVKPQSTSSAKIKTPQKSSKSKPSPKSSPSKQSTSKTSVPSPKRNENQMVMKETPEGFKPTKESLYCFIRLMWGMVEAGAVPPPPDLANITEFTAAFSNSEEIKHVVDSNHSRELIPNHEVLTLKGIMSGRRKMGRYIINIQEFFIKITQSSLSKLGIRVWGPNLLEPTDSLWNEACRMSALRIFRRVAIGGAFAYMNINKTYLENFDLLEGAYNHYVHYVMTEKYKKEAKQEGKNVQDEEKKVIQRARQRLRDARMKFATNQGFKQRYLDIISPVDAHSDDEYSEDHRCHIIKTLEFRSDNANAFFVRLTQEMEKNDRLEGKRSQGRVRRRPKKPVMSTIGRPPKNMPIDFFAPTWFNELTNAQRTKLADTYRVSLLPNAKLSFCSVSAADEKLGDKAFNAKFWDEITGFYNLSHVLGSDHDDDDDDEDNEEADSDYDEEIDLGETSGEEDEDEGEEEDDGDFVAEDEEEDEGFEDEFEDDAEVKHDVDGDARMFDEEDLAREERQDEDAYWNQWQ